VEVAATAQTLGSGVKGAANEVIVLDCQVPTSKSAPSKATQVAPSGQAEKIPSG
jgi:hypothetical protein